MVMEGFDDLKPHKVIGGKIFAESSSDKPLELQMFVGPNGALFARPIEPVPIDQVGEKQETKRHQGVDQI